MNVFIRWARRARLDKSKMNSNCRSAHRCSHLSCRACCWRNALHASRLIEEKFETDRLFYCEIDIAASAFASFRIELRNAISYRRRVCPAWSSVGLCLWQSNDSKARGIVGIGSTSQFELCSPLNHRWPITLQPIVSCDLRRTIYRVTHPDMIAFSSARRYQSIRVFISPTSASRYDGMADEEEEIVEIEPMPFLF